MAKPTTTKAYSLIITTVFLVALPCPRAQLTPAPAPASDCYSYLLNLSGCLTFVEPGSNLTKPDKECCPELSNLLNTKPICLCQLLRDPNQFGFTVDMKKALQLPSACDTPPVSFCSVLGVPVGAPAPSEGPSGQGPTTSFGGPVAANPAPGNRVLGVPVGAPAPSEGPSGQGPTTSFGGPVAANPAPGNRDNGSPRNLASTQHFLVGLAIILFINLFY